ncbi:hypothetical protein ACFV1L_10345 [Kitasatospora sp. NPDC059646]|uniref:hypothetical protein n=1 Tax=Kitasatospora sp. NPDC059646 TaxID=3346893 RepID=UPI003698B9F4
MSIDFDKLGAEMDAEKAMAEKLDAQVKALGEVCGKLTGVLLILPLRAWLFMLGVGALHGAVPAVPPLGFGAALLVVVGLAALLPARVKGAR